MPRIVPRSRACLLMAVSAMVVGFFLAGCVEPQPPPMTTEGFEAAKKDREEIIRKEYGESAYKQATREAAKSSPKAK